LLQKGLKQEYGIFELPLFEYNEFGKPSLTRYPAIHFNMSHCKRAVVCLLANHPVGVDVEEITPFDPDVARYVLNSKEYERMVSSDNPAEEFTILWTMKESLIKLTGVGIDDELLPDLLQDILKYNFQTTVNREKGYVTTTCSSIM
ncbi:MAG: 4'-phosphopantetheinyl transferase superfamily protein, partial [Bacteroides sp.]